MAKVTRTERRYRYNVDMSEDMRVRLEEVAQRRNLTMAILVRRFIELGLTAEQLQDAPNSAVLLRQNGKSVAIRVVP